MSVWDFYTYNVTIVWVDEYHLQDFCFQFKILLTIAPINVYLLFLKNHAIISWKKTACVGRESEEALGRFPSIYLARH